MGVLNFLFRLAMRSQAMRQAAQEELGDYDEPPTVYPVDRRGGRPPTVYPVSGEPPMVYPAALMQFWQSAQVQDRPFGERREATEADQVRPVVYGEDVDLTPEVGEIPISEWIPGQSTAIERYRWTPFASGGGQFGIMEVQFVGGSKVYAYPNVPWIELRNMWNAPSRGRFVTYHLRPRYSVGIGRAWRVTAPRATTALRARGRRRR